VKAGTPPSGDPRVDAARALVRVLNGRARSTDEVHQARSRWPGDPRDAALFQTLLMGVLRRRMALAHALRPLLKRPLEDAPAPVREVLLCLAFQALFLDRVPSHARVSASVEATRRLAGEGAARFVNAVGRGLERRLAEGDPLAGLPAAVRASVPPAVMGQIRAADPGPWDDGLLEALAQPAASVLRVNPASGNREDAMALLASRGVSARATALAAGGIAVDEGTPLADRGLVPRRLVPQDEASQLVVEALAPRDGERVLDLCAGNGLKTAQILGAAPGARVLAVDLDGRKLGRTRELCAAMGLPAPQTQAGDAGALGNGPLAGTADAVLLDAPCTGLGTLVRRPEVRYLRDEGDVARAAALQARLLQAAMPLVRPGGRLVYAVCSFAPAEGPAVVADALARSPGWSLAPLDLGGPALAPDGTLRTLPWRHGMDGFYVACLRRG
jgi:16S rRNA (cytosine967-C5)-methyltransferase